MINKLKNLLGIDFNHQPDEQQVQLAAAALLVEVMMIDGELNLQEQQSIKQLLVSQFGVDENNLEEFFSTARQQNAESTSLFQFTRLINENYSQEQKFRLMIALWKVAFADQRIDKNESHSLRRIAELLNLRHSEFIQAKQLARD